MSGGHMRAEMAQQPAVLRRLIERLPSDQAAIRQRIPAPLAGVIFVARGSSNNAAVLGRYLAELAARRPASLGAPSLHTLYASETDFSGYVVVGLSQSGATPEINTVMDRIHCANGCTVAITNDPRSSLAIAADVLYELDAGPERAIPATKTITAQMLAVIVLAAALGDPLPRRHHLVRLPDAVAHVLASPAPAQALAEQWRDLNQLVVVARGMGYATALESALKIKELTGIQAEGFSAADFRHGPVAILRPDTPMLIIDLLGPGSDDLTSLAAAARGRGAPVAVCSPVPGADLPLEPNLDEPLQGIVATIRAQQLALALAELRGHDPDQPGGLSKVTLTE